MKFLRRPRTSPTSVFRHSEPLTIRWATPDDADALGALAEIDEAEIPAAPLMVGFVGTQLWAAVSLCTGATIADPFRPSGQLAELLRERGRQLTVSAPRSSFGLARLRRRPSNISLTARAGHGAGF